MKVASASPDTGQQGGASERMLREAHALSGKAVRALDLFVSHEKEYFSRTPLRACAFCPVFDGCHAGARPSCGGQSCGGDRFPDSATLV